MRIVHAADLHVGCNRGFDHDLVRPRAAVRELLQLVADEKPKVLVLAGDLLDHAQPTHEERAIIADLFAKCPVPIVAITGTHDRWGKEFHQTSLNWLTPICDKLGHRVWDRPTASEFAGAWWVALPFNAWKQTDLDLITAALESRIPRRFSGPVIGMSHEFYRNAMTDIGFAGGEKFPFLPISKRVDYWALGDVHKHQRVGKNAYYSGSMYQTDFGERLPKGVLVVEIGSKPRFLPLTTPKPLVELTSVPESWPKAFVKLSVDADKVPSPLPECVVMVNTRSKRTPIDIDVQVSEDDPLRGLATWLKQKKRFTPDMVKRAMTLARGLREQRAA